MPDCKMVKIIRYTNSGRHSFLIVILRWTEHSIILTPERKLVRCLIIIFHNLHGFSVACHQSGTIVFKFWISWQNTSVGRFILSNIFLVIKQSSTADHCFKLVLDCTIFRIAENTHCCCDVASYFNQSSF